MTHRPAGMHDTPSQSPGTMTVPYPTLRQGDTDITTHIDTSGWL